MSQKFKSDIEVQAGLRDSSGSLGTSGQVLSTTGTTTSWINQTTIANDVQNRVKAGVAINKGQAVYVTGADGTNIIVGLASNTTEATSSKTLGLLNATVAINGMADVVQIGKLAGLNTLGAVAGDPVWLGVNGNLIYGLANKPYAPAHLVFIGIVTRVNSNNGEIFVNVQNGFELKEIHDVDIVTNVPINGDVLGYDGTLWVNKTIAEWLGYTPANASGTTNYVSKFTGAATLGNSQIFDNGTNVGIGDSNPGYKLTVIGNGYFNDNVLIGNGSQLRFTIPGINIKPELVSSTWSDLSFSTNNSEKMRITSSGNVGIGTTAFNFAAANRTNLAINGGVSSIIEWQSSGSSLGYAIVSSSDFNIGSVTAIPLTLSTNATERMRITSSGNVGIGTTSPTSGISSTETTLQIQNGNVAALALNNSASRKYTIYSGVGGQLGFYDVTGGAERITLSSSGNVGIGTTSPSGKLSILNSNGLLNISNGNTSGGTKIQSFASSSADSNGYLAFEGYTAEYMRITSGGNVGIGTSSPASYSGYTSLCINNASNGGLLDLQNNGTSALRLSADSTTQVSIYGATNVPMVFSTNATERMRITSGGNVGIGTTSPSKKLDVNGDALINGLTVGRGAGDIASNTVIGFNSLISNTIGSDNLAVGVETLTFNTTGAANTAVGNYTLRNNTIGYSNIAIGYGAGYNLTTGYNNTFIGRYAGSSASTANDCTVIGGYLTTTVSNFNLSQTLSIEKPDTAVNNYLGESAGLPHIWAPQTVQVTDTLIDTLISVNYQIYSAIFIEYNLEDTNGNMRAGAIKAIWNSDASTIKMTEETTDSIGDTSGCVIQFNVSGLNIDIQLANNNGYTVYINTTSRILIRPTIQLL